MNKNRIVIELEEPTCTLLGVRSRRNLPAQVLACRCRITEQGVPESFSRARRRFDPNGDCETILLLARRQVTLKYFSLPARHPQELRRMVELMLPEEVPFAREEILYDVWIGPTGDDDYTRVIAAVARRSVVEHALSRAQELSFDVRRCAVGFFGLLAWNRLRPGAVPDTTLVCAVSDTAVDLCICRDRTFLFARGFFLPESGSGLDIDYFSRQLTLSLRAFSLSYPGQTIQRIVSAVGAHDASAVNNVLQRITQHPVESVESFEDTTVQFSEDGTEDPRVVPVAHPALWGMALAEDPGPDLIPAEVLTAARVRERRAASLQLGIAAVFAGIAFAVALWGTVQQCDRQVGVLRGQIAEDMPAQQRAQRIIALAAFVREQFPGQVLVADIVRELYRVIPEGTALTSLKYSGTALTIRGSADSTAVVNTVQRKLMESSFLREATLQYANQRNYAGRIEFQIACRVDASGRRR